MRIGLAYNEKPDSAPAEEPSSTNDAFAEWDDPSTIAAVEQALGRFGTVTRLEADQFFPQKLALARPDLVFNMVEGLHGQSREALVPAICEYLNIPYTGSDPLTLALSLHKGRTKEILAYRGVPTAPFRVIERAADLERMPLPFPLFVKPVAEGSGKGIFVNNLCDSPAILAERVLFLLERYAPPVRRPSTATKQSGSGTRPTSRSTSSSAPPMSRPRSIARSSRSRSTPIAPSVAVTGVEWTSASIVSGSPT